MPWRCLVGSKPQTKSSNRQEHNVVSGHPTNSGNPEHWEVLYRELPLVDGHCFDRLAKLSELVASAVGAALVSVSLVVPEPTSCMVAVSSKGILQEAVQLGHMEALPAGAAAGGGAGAAGNAQAHFAGGSSAPATAAATGRPPPLGPGPSAEDAAASSLQLVFVRKAPLYRHVTGGGANGAATIESVRGLPHDWQRLAKVGDVVDFAALPIVCGERRTLVGTLSVAISRGSGAPDAGQGPGSGAATTQSPSDGGAANQQQQHHSRHGDAAGAGGNGGGGSALQRDAAELQRLASVIALSAFSDPEQLRRMQAVCGACAAAQQAPSLAAMVEGVLLSLEGLIGGPTTLRLAGARCVLALGDTMEGRTAYFALGGTGPGAVPDSQGRWSASAVGAAAAPKPPAGAAQGVLGPLVDTLLLECITGKGPATAGRVVANCRAHLAAEERPGRDVQVCFQLVKLRPSCMALAVASSQHSTLAPVLGLYACFPDMLPQPLLDHVLAEVQRALAMVLPHIHSQLLGALAGEYQALRLQPTSALAALPGGGGSSAGGAASGSLGRAGSDMLLSTGSLQGGRPGSASVTLSMSVDEWGTAAPAQLKLIVTSIQTTITNAKVQQAWQATGEHGTQEANDDLYSIRLLETIGQGGQGVVFRGLMHGLEVAIKVLAKDVPPKPNPADAPAASPQQQQQTTPTGAGAGRGAAPAGAAAAGKGLAAAAAAVSPAPGSAADQAVRAAKRELLRDALELAVTSAVHHPNIVQVFNYFTEIMVVEFANEADGNLRLIRQRDAGDEMAAKGPTNLVIVMEYCDAGTLKDALKRGFFKKGHDDAGWPRLDMAAIYLSLLEVALALRHLHSLNLVHCDIKPSNVLCQSSARDPRRWTCKLSDFGCVRVLNAGGGATGLPPHFTVTRALGTLTHMAPEVMTRGQQLTASVDMYSFGILMWELLTGLPHDHSLPGKEAIQLARKGVRPALPHYTPQDYREVMVACWSHDPSQRPSSVQLVNVLQALLTKARSGPGLHSTGPSMQPLPAAAAPAGLAGSPAAAAYTMQNSPAAAAAPPQAQLAPRLATPDARASPGQQPQNAPPPQGAAAAAPGALAAAQPPQGTAGAAAAASAAAGLPPPAPASASEHAAAAAGGPGSRGGGAAPGPSSGPGAPVAAGERHSSSQRQPLEWMASPQTAGVVPGQDGYQSAHSSNGWQPS